MRSIQPQTRTLRDGSGGGLPQALRVFRRPMASVREELDEPTQVAARLGHGQARGGREGVIQLLRRSGLQCRWFRQCATAPRPACSSPLGGADAFAEADDRKRAFVPQGRRLQGRDQMMQSERCGRGDARRCRLPQHGTGEIPVL